MKSILEYVDELSTAELLDFVNKPDNDVASKVGTKYFGQFPGVSIQADSTAVETIETCIYARIGRLWAEMHTNKEVSTKFVVGDLVTVTDSGSFYVGKKGRVKRVDNVIVYGWDNWIVTVEFNSTDKGVPWTHPFTMNDLKKTL